nr:PREDICTED: uncharacterized protein LOC109042007 [Bemisia tabaci]
MGRNELFFISKATCLVLFGYLLVPAGSHCCPALLSGSCPMDKLSSTYACCSYGKCNLFCCNCELECRLKGCSYELEDAVFSDVSDPEVRVSNTLHCSRAGPSCHLSLTIQHVFEASTELGVQLSVPVLRLINDRFAVTYRANVTERTAAGLGYRCAIPPGHRGWATQAPRFAVLAGAFVHRCCHPRGKCNVTARRSFRFRKPIVAEQGLNVGDIYCRTQEDPLDVAHGPRGEGGSRLRENFILVLFLMLAGFLLLYMFVYLASILLSLYQNSTARSHS